MKKLQNIQPIKAIITSSYLGNSVECDTCQNGLFTHYFLRAIKNKEARNTNRNGFIDLNELYEWVRTKVMNDTNCDQMPYLISSKKSQTIVLPIVKL